MPAKRNPHTMQPRQWYGTQAWRRRAADQIRREPLCRECLRFGETRPAFAADHVHQFHDLQSFTLGPLQSLCKRCSDAKQRGNPVPVRIGVDGLPLQPRDLLTLKPMGPQA